MYAGGTWGRTTRRHPSRKATGAKKGSKNNLRFLPLNIPAALLCSAPVLVALCASQRRDGLDWAVCRAAAGWLTWHGWRPVAVNTAQVHVDVHRAREESSVLAIDRGAVAVARDSRVRDLWQRRARRRRLAVRRIARGVRADPLHAHKADRSAQAGPRTWWGLRSPGRGCTFASSSAGAAHTSGYIGTGQR